MATQQNQKKNENQKDDKKKDSGKMGKNQPKK